MPGQEPRQGGKQLFPFPQEARPDTVLPGQLELRDEPRIAPEVAPGGRAPIALGCSPDIVVPPPAEELAADGVHLSERASECSVITAPADLQVLEHEKGVLAILPVAQRYRDPGAGVGERAEAVDLGCKIVEQRAVVDFREVLAPAALEHEAAVDAAS